MYAAFEDFLPTEELERLVSFARSAHRTGEASTFGAPEDGEKKLLIERQLTCHGYGDFFGLHNDSGGIGVESRAMTYVYYFNAEPTGFEGGALRLYSTVERDGLICQWVSK